MLLEPEVGDINPTCTLSVERGKSAAIIFRYNKDAQGGIALVVDVGENKIKVVRALDFSDDRLSELLRALSNDEQWEAFEGTLNRRLLRRPYKIPRCMNISSMAATFAPALIASSTLIAAKTASLRPNVCNS